MALTNNTYANNTHASNISHHPTRTAVTKEPDVAHEILRTVEELKKGSGFGSVEIVLHEGRVTQIEKREKLRFNHSANHDIQKR